MSSNQNRGLLRTIQDFLTSYDGKIILNFAYSWGAAVVILGTLFKLTHLPGANIMLYIGMGTEVLVFFVSAFDRPAKTYRWESVFPDLEITGKVPHRTESLNIAGDYPELIGGTAAGNGGGTGGAGGATPSVVYMGGGGGTGTGAPISSEEAYTQGTGQSATGTIGGGATIIGGGGYAGPAMPEAPVIPAEEMEEATKSYLDKLKEMTESIGRLNEQMDHFTCDPDQMEGVNRHIAGLNAIFELQLRSASKQVESVDKVHEQTEKMAAQIEELNKVYARMLQAMTANMNHQSFDPNK